MASAGWPHVDAWVDLACDIAPTIVGGSKKHGQQDHHRHEYMELYRSKVS